MLRAKTAWMGVIVAVALLGLPNRTEAQRGEGCGYCGETWSWAFYEYVHSFYSVTGEINYSCWSREEKNGCHLDDWMFRCLDEHSNCVNANNTIPEFLRAVATNDVVAFDDVMAEYLDELFLIGNAEKINLLLCEPANVTGQREAAMHSSDSPVWSGNSRTLVDTARSPVANGPVGPGPWDERKER